jgi:hypothetical protein
LFFILLPFLDTVFQVCVGVLLQTIWLSHYPRYFASQGSRGTHEPNWTNQILLPTGTLIESWAEEHNKIETSFLLSGSSNIPVLIFSLLGYWAGFYILWDPSMYNGKFPYCLPELLFFISSQYFFLEYLQVPVIVFVWMMTSLILCNNSSIVLPIWQMKMSLRKINLSKKDMELRFKFR